MRLTLDTVSPTFGLAVPSLGPYRLTEKSNEPIMPPAMKTMPGMSMGPTVIACPASRSGSRSSSSRRSRSPAYRYPRHIVSDRPTPMQHATIPTPNFGGLSTTYDVPGLISVPNIAHAHTVTIAELALDAEFSWLVVPKVDLRAHLKVSKQLVN